MEKEKVYNWEIRKYVELKKTLYDRFVKALQRVKESREKYSKLLHEYASIKQSGVPDDFDQMDMLKINIIEAKYSFEDCETHLKYIEKRMTLTDDIIERIFHEEF